MQLACCLRVLLACSDTSAYRFTAACQSRLRIRSRHYNGLHVFAEFRLSAGRPHLCEKRLNLTECGEDLAMRRAERIAVNGARGDQRGSHVPIAENHAERGVALPADGRNELGETLGVELNQEPGARLSQNGFAAKVEQLKIQLSTLERCRHNDLIVLASSITSSTHHVSSHALITPI